MRQTPAWSADLHELHNEHKRLVRRDLRLLSLRAIGKVPGDHQDAFAADLHARDALDPSLDEPAVFKWELCRLSAE